MTASDIGALPSDTTPTDIGALPSAILAGDNKIDTASASISTGDTTRVYSDKLHITKEGTLRVILGYGINGPGGDGYYSLYKNGVLINSEVLIGTATNSEVSIDVTVAVGDYLQSAVRMNSGTASIYANLLSIGTDQARIENSYIEGYSMSDIRTKLDSAEESIEVLEVAKSWVEKWSGSSHTVDVSTFGDGQFLVETVINHVPLSIKQGVECSNVGKTLVTGGVVYMYETAVSPTGIMTNTRVGSDETEVSDTITIVYKWQ